MNSTNPTDGCAIGTPDEDHDWEFQDDSFDHEFGTEQIHYFKCNRCGREREMQPCDYEE